MILVTYPKQVTRAVMISLFSVLASQCLLSPEATAQNDPQSCLVARPLPEERRTEVLPKGVCPIKLGQVCYDKSYGLETSNKCGIPIRIYIEAGTPGTWAGSTGVYTLPGNAKREFRCLESNSQCKGVQARVLGFSGSQQTVPPKAAMRDGNGTSSVFFVRDGTVLPNEYGGKDLYYLKGDQWFVTRTGTNPKVPDYTTDESVKFYADPKGGFYVVGSSGDTWWVRPNPPNR